ncbi:MAG: xanthine dehydrogenase family protein subunit M [Polyangia bacterium]
METFEYIRARDLDQALAQLGTASARALAGGTDLVERMRLGVERPARLVDLNGLNGLNGHGGQGPLGRIESTAAGLRIGALVRNSDLAQSPLVLARFPVLAQALLAGASPQIRNVATLGGNLMQRTRCPYFRDAVSPCNKREPGSGCAAQHDGADQRGHAILGTSDACIAAHPSDLCVALLALDATVQVVGPDRRERTLPLLGFHLLPGPTPERETVLAPGELVVAVTLPESERARRSRYVKVADRAALDFALAAAAVAIELDGEVLRSVRIALGGVGTRPWRALESEHELAGQRPTPERLQRAATAAVATARASAQRAFKIELAQRVLIRALREALPSEGKAS